MGVQAHAELCSITGLAAVALLQLGNDPYLNCNKTRLRGDWRT